MKKNFIFKHSCRPAFIGLILFLACRCIDPYDPQLSNYESLLVVDALITDANSSYKVKLSRTFQDENALPVSVSDATVFISDEGGGRSYLQSTGNGVYKTDSLEFTGSVGRTYVLHVVTSDGEEFESDPCKMEPVPEIDSAYFAKGEELINNGTESQPGIRIFIDSKGSEINQYYRWEYEETWKFRVPNPKKYEYIQGVLPNYPIIVPVEEIKEFCWKSSHSDEIIIKSISEGQSGIIEQQPVLFIATDKTDRLLVEYSVLIKQYSLSKNEYEFWNNLKQINETGGDIFAKQPYSVISNIHNITNPNERILGYFQVSAVSHKRKNITFGEVAILGLPFYTYPCKTWKYEPLDFETRCLCPPKTWDDVYWYLSIASDYIFIQPEYQGSGDSILLKLEFTRPECADCELTGSRTEPDFWDEFN
jgi:hypothetical protein